MSGFDYLSRLESISKIHEKLDKNRSTKAHLYTYHGGVIREILIDFINWQIENNRQNYAGMIVEKEVEDFLKIKIS